MNRVSFPNQVSRREELAIVEPTQGRELTFSNITSKCDNHNNIKQIKRFQTDVADYKGVCALPLFHSARAEDPGLSSNENRPGVTGEL